MARLEEYRRKRNFQRTPEPAGRQRRGPRTRRGPKSRGGVFVVHKHAARRLHYDLRLEHDGVLESWAVPKGPSVTPGEKRLAVRTEDHPMEYGDFEGVIPEGEYGGGTVMLWDRGRWREQRRTDGRLDFELEGHKLRGRWTLTRMRGRSGKDEDNWLLIKRSDPEDGEPAPQGHAALPEDESVATGRTMDQIAADRSRTWSAEGEAAPAPDPPAPSRLPRARRDSMPETPRPQLATLVREPPRGPGWLHEIKFDGYRILARVEHGQARLMSRNGKDWTGRFPEITGLLEDVPADALLDGEVVALGADGSSSFRRLQEALSAKRTERLVYQAFDLLHLDGFDLTATPQAARKRALAEVLESAGLVGSARIRYTDHLDGQGDVFFDNVCRLGLEGIVSKRANAPYREGRNRHWLKLKCTRHEELVIGGYTDPSGGRTGFGALLLGAYHEGRLVYTGKVGTGFSDRQLEDMHRRLAALEVKDSPFRPPPRERGVHWVRPELVAEVEFAERTRDGMLRHPTFRGLREDREPEEIVVKPDAGPARESSPVRGGPGHRGRGQNRKQDEAVVAGVKITNPDRVLYPGQGVTKLALARYYEAIGNWILPLLAERPLSLLRCPEGRAKACFFQKHPGQTFGPELPRVRIQEKSGGAEHLYVRRLPDLVALVQMGTLELHVWGSRVSDLEHPDLLVLDLDPGPGVAWSDVLRAARSLNDRLAQLGLAGFPRTTGGKGLHVVVPLEPSLDWDGVKAFARGVAHAHAHDEPRKLTVNMAKSKRQGRIFIDYLRNGRGATAIASYSTRAREGAPVAVPVRWDELGPALTSDRYRLENVRRRLSTLRADPWDGFDQARRPLTTAMLEAVGAADGGRR